MTLGRQWDERIKIWVEYLPKFFFTPIQSVPMKFCTTMEHLSFEQAETLSYQDAPEGLSWGKKWEYGWFKFNVALNKNALGKRIVLFPDAGGESLVYVNGQEAGAIDKQHKYITLTTCAKGTEKYEIIMETYAGHGIRPENGGPYAAGEVSVPEPPEKQNAVGKCVWGIWNEEVYQTAMDLNVLYSLAGVLDEKSLRAQKVGQALKNFTLAADYELPEPERTQSIVAARKILAPALAATNGTSAPTMSLFGQSHIDLAWLWPLEETKRKVARTYSTQLSLMAEYPEFQFLACEPYLLELAAKYHPALYKRIKKTAEAGQIFADGAYWVENDTNLPCGEALIRQFLWGSRWFVKEFGTKPKTAWIPDSFGFSGALPQILKGCEIPYFTTQKLLRIDPECDQFPYNHFWWEGIDGTRILSHIYKKNNCVITPKAIWERWNNDRIQKENIEEMIFPFGYGDGGGGPTRDMLEVVRRVSDLEGIPRTKYQQPSQFFQELEQKHCVNNVYTGELYLSWHRGSLTSQARTKALSRRAEQALHNAEFLQGIACFSNLRNPTADEKIHDAWDRLLFAQFHDIVSGTSIKRVHDEAEETLAKACSLAKEAFDAYLSALVPDISDKSVLVNTLGWERKAQTILAPYSISVFEKSAETEPVSDNPEASDHDQNDVPNDVDVIEKIPVSCCVQNENGLCSVVLENGFLRIAVDQAGRLSSVFDKESSCEFALGPCNNLRLYKDVTPFYDAWELSPMYRDAEVPLAEEAEITVEQSTGLIARLKVVRRIHDSSMTQFIVLRRGSRQIDFETSIDWKEKHKFLKAEFPLAVQTDESISEIQFGNVRRSTHKNRQYDKDRYEACNQHFTALDDGVHGAAVLNNCKYGVSADKIPGGNLIGLSLLKAALVPDMFADQGMQHFTYSLYTYKGSFAESGVVKAGYELNQPVAEKNPEHSEDCAQFESRFSLVRSFSYFSLDNPRIVLETVKTAEDKSGNIVLRLYESYGGIGRCTLSTSLSAKSWTEANMLEEPESDSEAKKWNPVKNGAIPLEFKPFEIKTIILKK